MQQDSSKSGAGYYVRDSDWKQLVYHVRSTPKASNVALSRNLYCLISRQSGAIGGATATLSTDQVESIAPGTANPIASSIPGQNARRTFSGSAGQQVNLQITNSTFVRCPALNFSILRPDGSQLAENGTCNVAPTGNQCRAGIFFGVRDPRPAWHRRSVQCSSRSRR
jgi:hypothetical protein